MAYTRISLGLDSSGRKCVVNARTKKMMDETYRLLGKSLVVIKGSYISGTSATSGTHDGGGVVDFRSWDLASKGLSITKVLTELRRVGFAAWYRTKAQGFDPHIHAVAIGDLELSASAARQVEAYRLGKNGLAGGGPDDGPKMPFRTWEQYLKTLAPPPLEELLTMELTDKITIPATYASNLSNRDASGNVIAGKAKVAETVTVETMLRRIYEWSFKGGVA